MITLIMVITRVFPNLYKVGNVTNGEEQNKFSQKIALGGSYWFCSFATSLSIYYKVQNITDIGEIFIEFKRLVLIGILLRAHLHHVSGEFGVNAAMKFSLTTMESLENGVATHFGATPLWSMRTVSRASSQC